MSWTDIAIWVGVAGFILAVIVVAGILLKSPPRPKSGPLAEAQKKMDRESWRWTNYPDIWPR